MPTRPSRPRGTRWGKKKFKGYQKAKDAVADAENADMDRLHGGARVYVNGVLQQRPGTVAADPSVKPPWE